MHLKTNCGTSVHTCPQCCHKAFVRLFYLTGYPQMCHIDYSASRMTKTTITSAFWSAHILAAWTTNDTDRENTVNFFTATMSIVAIFLVDFLCTVAVLFTGSPHQKKENRTYSPALKSTTSHSSNQHLIETLAWLTASIQRHCSVFFPFPLTLLMHTVRECCLINHTDRKSDPKMQSNKAMSIRILPLHLILQLWCRFYHNTANILCIIVFLTSLVSKVT